MTANDRSNNDIKELLRIPKRSMLKNTILLACQLYGEAPESAQEYANEQVESNENCLDDAISCFKSVANGVKTFNGERLASKATSVAPGRQIVQPKRNFGLRGSRLNPIKVDKK